MFVCFSTYSSLCWGWSHASGRVLTSSLSLGADLSPGQAAPGCELSRWWWWWWRWWWWWWWCLSQPGGSQRTGQASLVISHQDWLLSDFVSHVLVMLWQIFVSFFLGPNPLWRIRPVLPKISEVLGRQSPYFSHRMETSSSLSGKTFGPLGMAVEGHPFSLEESGS